MAEHPYTNGRHVSQRMKALLADLSPRVVVIGSVARGKQFPKDLDLLFDFDSDQAYAQVKAIVGRHSVPFDSCFPGNWCFREGVMIEILGIHYGKTYKACRRAGQKHSFWGVELIVAPADYCLSKEDWDRAGTTSLATR